MQRRWLLWLVCFVVYTVAIWSRYRYFDAVEIYSDSLSPYLAATRVLHTGFSDPPNPESDHWLWATAIPQVVLSGSLRELFLFRLGISALVAPMGFLTALELCRVKNIEHGFLIGSIVGVILAFDVGLIDTFVSSFRGYMAPEWVGLSFLFFVYAQSRENKWLHVLSLLCIPISGGHHPLALGVVLCSLLYVEKLRFMTIVVLILAFSGRIIWLWEIVQCDAGGLACISEIASGSSEQITSSDILQRIWKERILGEMGLWGIFYAIGICIPFFQRKIQYVDKWVYLSGIGLVLLGLSLSTLRPYHLRILSVPFTVLAVVNISYLQRYSYILVGIIWCFTSPKQIQTLSNIGISFHDEQGQFLLSRRNPFWLEGTIDSEQKCSSSGVVLSAYLQGLSVDLIPSQPEGDLLVLDCKKVNDLGTIKNVDKIQQSVNLEELVGAFDWARAFHSDDKIILKW